MKAETNFEKMAANGRESSFAVELWAMLRSRKRSWPMPIVIVLLLFGVLVFLSGTAAAPFIYTLF